MYSTISTLNSDGYIGFLNGINKLIYRIVLRTAQTVYEGFHRPDMGYYWKE